MPQDPPQIVEAPPPRLWLHDLREMLAWYEQNLCNADLRDPRGHRVKFSPERFPHLIKLLRRASNKEVNEPQKVVNAIRTGTKCNADFGGYHTERFQGLSWMPCVISRPTKILEVVTLFEKPGDTLYVKQFNKAGYKFKVLVCRRVGPSLLVPVTCHPRDHDRYGEGFRQVWP
jgi:hypothetical protein